MTSLDERGEGPLFERFSFYEQKPAEKLDILEHPIDQ
jgi:hypothetical protein